MTVGWLQDLGAEAGELVAVAVDDCRYGLAFGDFKCGFGGSVDETVDAIRAIEAEIRPRWVWWDRTTPDWLVAHNVVIGRCWDVLTVHRLQYGKWCRSIVDMWIRINNLDPQLAPSMGQIGLLESLADEGTDAEDPLRPDGYLRPEWTSGGWSNTADRLATWAALALHTANAQNDYVGTAPITTSTRNVESTTELLCAELAYHGLPFDTDTALELIAAAAGPRPHNPADEERLRALRDAAVFELLPPGPPVDLRSPADVKATLRRIELDLPDTRAWRLEQHHDHHPVIPALLTWRKAERLATTYGYRWVDEHVHNGRLRGQWSSCDGAAGRMTASAGLHNMPAELRPAVRADKDHVFIRADLGQIEPRILAAVSGDTALIEATHGDDMYQPIADRLRVTRDVAKVAILGAMYGSTTGESAKALRGLEREYPTAMAFLKSAADTGYRGRSVHTAGGRPVHMWEDSSTAGNIDRARQVAAARGRFARNAVIQGSAAEFFKLWAVTVRTRGADIGCQVVLCLHDELLVHAPAEHSQTVVTMVTGALAEAAYRWSANLELNQRVRFVADTAIIHCWSDAKGK